MRKMAALHRPKVYVNPRAVEAQYAVRGFIPIRAAEIDRELQTPEGKGRYPFSSLVYCNIGNPQSLGQKPLTFPRQVMSLLDAPGNLENDAIVKSYPPDAIARARSYLSQIGSGTGAYTESFGYRFARQAVADFVNARDGKDLPGSPVTVEDVALTDGAGSAVKVVLQVLVGAPSDGVIIPIPQYPLYSASVTLLGGTIAPYYLAEEGGWAVSSSDLAAVFADCEAKKATPRVMVVINPGNPTGNVLDRTCMEEIVRFCHDKNIVLLADEVYQANIYTPDKSFLSFREVILSMPAPYNAETVLFSLHSVSKGIIGECGRRGGYICMTNVPDSVRDQVYKICSINVCPNVNGQIMTALMCTPPAEGDASYTSYWEEYNGIFNGLRERARHLVDELRTVPGITCQEVEGAMYAFPLLTMPAGYEAYNAEKNNAEGRELSCDTRWALDLLEAYGVVVVPGSGFGQKSGTLHFRTTILPPKEKMERVTKAIREHQERIMREYK